MEVPNTTRYQRLDSVDMGPSEPLLNLDAPPALLVGLDAPPPPPEMTFWKRWRVCAFSAVGAGGSLALRLFNYAKWTNALGSLGFGFFTQGAVSAAVKGDPLTSRVRRVVFRQICLTLLGQGTLFAFGQSFGNIKEKQVRKEFVDAIIGLLGANLWMVGEWLWQEGAVRMDSHVHAKAPGERFEQRHCSNQTMRDILKLGVAAACGTAYAAFRKKGVDPVVQGLSFCFAFYFFLQVTGRRAIHFVNRQIEKYEANPEVRTKREWLAIGLITGAFVGTAISFVRVFEAAGKRLLFGGIIFGTCQGVLLGGMMDRLKRIPVKLLEEFHKVEALQVPGQQERRALLVSRIVKIASPILTILGLTGFVVWQVKYELENLNDRLAMGALLAGFALTNFCHVVDWAWKPNVRHYYRDQLMTFFFALPSFLGINPFFIYLAGTNALKMNAQAIEKEGKNLFHLTVIFVAWFCYGISWARELYITSSDRVGNLLIKYPMMGIANGLMTMVGGIRGKEGVEA